jgi:hypothetical protein
MEKVEFTLNDGRVRQIARPIAVVLSKKGRGTYQTRDMARQPVVTKPMQAAPDIELEPAAEALIAEDDGLDGLDKDQLHALAKDRGVRVHHLAGADKVRAALREAA